MSSDNRSQLRDLVPKGYHFDAYNELNSPNSRDRPFFEEGVIPIGDYYLTKKFDSNSSLILQFSSVCPHGHISFEPYVLTFEEYIQLLRDALKSKSDFITFDIAIKHHGSEKIYCRGCDDRSKDCTALRKHISENTSEDADIQVAAVSFEPKDIKHALSVYFGITTNNHSSKGGNKMKANFKKMLGMNFEVGISKDSNIAATFMGVAVRNPATGNFYVYDPTSKTLKNYANMKFGNFKVFLLPETKLIVDQPYKLDGKYYYVQAVDGNMATLVDAVDGTVIQKILSECVIPGMNFYTRVVALDPRTMFDTHSKTDMTKNVLAAICMTQWSKGESDFSLDGLSDDSFNGLGMLLMMNGNSDLTQNLPMLLMMGAAGNESDEDGGMLQYWLLSQIMGGGNAGAENNGGGMNLFGSLPGFTQPAAVAAPVSETAGVVVCPNCGEEYPAGTNYCSNCGAHTEVKGKHCVNCGAVLMDGAAFCHNCGQKVVRDTCPNCNSKVVEGAKFCSACGCDLNTGKAPAAASPKKPGSGRKTGKGGSSRTAPKATVKETPAEKPAEASEKE